MEILLEELYKTDLSNEKYHDRKIFLDEKSYQIIGITQSGKTSLIKNYLLSLKKSSYLYIDCNDIRIEVDELNNHLSDFCKSHKIDTLVLDNYKKEIEFVNASQLIISAEIPFESPYLQLITLYPLDYEEFLAYEHKYDSSALNHFVQLGALPSMHKVAQDMRARYIQRSLKNSLNEIEFDIVVLSAKMISQKLSPFAIYERLKLIRKISKDKLYKNFELLLKKNYLHQLSKYDHNKAIKKLYLCDISLKAALSTEKHFGRLFENMIFLELLKAGEKCYYDEGIDFYIPQKNEIVLGMPFSDERALFKKIEQIEAFIFTHTIEKITAVTMNAEGSLSHPLSKVEMLPFDIWALGD